MKLLSAESEAAVTEILEGDAILSNPDNWLPLDKRDTNFNIVANQASDGGKALTELMTNMVDSVLMRHAYEKGINPKGKDAPATMYEAVDKLVQNMRGGKLVNLDGRDPWLKDFAERNLVVGITGAKSKAEGLPCFTFADNGEGQRPEDFEKTFLSLSAGHKKSIPFVQGKYNMGSSGVLGYCGDRWHKLIVSRRYDEKSPWGWTLIRRRPADPDEMPIAEYFAPDGKIASFEAEVLHPFAIGSGERYEGMRLASGSVVKLYDYQIGSGFLSFRGSREAMNENLVETILPFRLLDFRQKPDAKRVGERALGIDPRPFYGMEFLLVHSHREDGLTDEGDAVGERTVHVGKVKDPTLGEITIRAIVLKSLPGWLDESRRNNRVFHAVNGQVQFKRTRGYLSQSCKLSALMDRVVVVVDASNLHPAAHHDIWKGDREHIRNTRVGELYQERVTEAIRESRAMREWQDKIARQELEKTATAESNALFQKLADSDPNIVALLSERDPVIRIPLGGGDKEDKQEEWKGKYSPTFLRFEEKIGKQKEGIDIPINKRRPIPARTDAENGYLDRPDNPGTLVLPEEIERKFARRESLHDGRLVVYLTPVASELKVGDEFELELSLRDDAMPEAVKTETVVLRIVEEDNSKKQSNRQDKTKQKSRLARGLPECVLLTKDGREIEGYSCEQWPGDFNENDGGTISDLGEDRVVYKINYDNAYHIKYRTRQRGQVAKDAVTQKYILGMRILMLGFEHAFRNAQQSPDGEQSLADSAGVFRRMCARGAASTVLSLAEQLPKIVDKSKASQADE